jgi:hypothetical protein
MNATTESNSPLTDALAEALNTCIERGFVLPFHAAAVGLNGSTLVMRYLQIEDGGVAPQVLAEH